MEIENATGKDVNSKLSPLIDAFTRSPFAAAPERKQALEKIRDRLDLRIRMDGTEKDWIFEGASLFGAHHHIKVSLRSLERLWGCCYAYSAIVLEILASGEAQTPVTESPEYILAFGLLDWIAQDTLQDREGEWPEHLPNPNHRELLKHVEFADHLFLMTSGRILLHEIAHLALEHSSNPDADPESLIQEEFEADAWADDWMLSDWQSYNDDPKVFQGRTMGIAFSHAIILFFGAKRSAPSKSHPNPIDRINRFVEDHLPTGSPLEKNPDHVACAFLLAIIGHLLMAKGVTPDVGDLSCSYADLFARFRLDFN